MTNAVHALTRAQRFINLALRLRLSIGSRLRIACYRWLGCTIESRCRLHRIHIPRNPWDVTIGSGTYIDDGTILLSTGLPTGQPRIVIGQGCGINRYSFIDASERIELDDHCRVGPFVYITDHDHGTAPGGLISSQPLVGKPVRVGRDVWLGAGVTILKGVTIGDGAIVGAGAVVTKSIPPATIYAGIPARQIGERQ